MKQNLMNDKKTIKLGIANWKVSNAYPPSDIIWSEFQNILEKEESWGKVAYPFLNHSCSMFLLLTTVYLDSYAFKNIVPALLVCQYFSPLILTFFILYLNPQLMLILTEWEYNERKSVKE